MALVRMLGIDTQKKGIEYYEVVDNGYKYNMTDMAASLGLVQLKRADELNKKRADIAKRYIDAFSSVNEVTVLAANNDVLSSWHLFVIKVQNRDHVMAKLKESGVGTSLHFIPIFIHPYYKKRYGFKAENFPVAQSVYDQSISLPIFPDMTMDDVDYVIETVLNNV